MFDFGAYEDCIELNLETVDIDVRSLNWKPYNPRKTISRFGCSITSLDGGDNGVPDLDSLIEYNRLNSTNLSEIDFRKPTVHSQPFEKFLENFQCGRSHFLKLGAGGFFPWHRDNDQKTFRIIYTVSGCEFNDLVWIQGDRVLQLQNNRWYYINTKKRHCLFSLTESTMAVFNVLTTHQNIQKLFQKFKIQ